MDEGAALSDDNFERALLDQMPGGIAIYDLDGELVYSNACHAALVSSARLPSRVSNDAQWRGIDARGGEIPSHLFPCERAFHGETSRSAIHLIRRDPAGGERHLRVSAAPIRSPRHGRIVGIVLLLADLPQGLPEVGDAASPALMATPVLDFPLYLVGEGRVGTLLSHDGERQAKCKSFASIREYLDIAPYLAPGCVVIDVRSASDSQTDLARALGERRHELPTVVVGEDGTHPATAIAAMHAGAVDYLVPPIDPVDLRAALGRAVHGLRSTHPLADPEVPDRLARLSQREREVLGGLVEGGTNKTIGRTLGISPRTVEVHRAHLMERLNVSSLAELLRVVHEGRATQG